MEKRWHCKKWTSHRSGSWSEPKLCGRIEVQMNPGCLFASSDVVCWEGMHLESCFSALAVKQSCGSVKSWPSVGEIWIIGGLFHGFLLCEFFHVSLSSFTPSAVFVSKMFFFFWTEGFQDFWAFSYTEYEHRHCTGAYSNWFCRSANSGESLWMSLKATQKVWRKGPPCRLVAVMLSWQISLTLCRSPQMHPVVEQHQLPGRL